MFVRQKMRQKAVGSIRTIRRPADPVLVSRTYVLRGAILTLLVSVTGFSLYRAGVLPSLTVPSIHVRSPSRFGGNGLRSFSRQNPSAPRSPARSLDPRSSSNLVNTASVLLSGRTSASSAVCLAVRRFGCRRPPLMLNPSRPLSRWGSHEANSRGSGSSAMRRRRSVSAFSSPIRAYRSSMSKCRGRPLPPFLLLATTTARLVGSEIHDNPGTALAIRAGAAPVITQNVFRRNGMSQRTSGTFIIEKGATPLFQRNVFLGVGPDVFTAFDAARSREVEEARTGSCRR